MDNARRQVIEGDPPPRRRVGSLSVVARDPQALPMPTSEELTSLLLAVAAQRDRPAFAALFKHFAPRLKSFLMRSGTPAELAEELAQETMVCVWRKAASFDPGRARVSTWIFTIARNLRVDWHRRGHTSQEVPLEIDSLADTHAAIEDGDAPPEEQLHLAQREHRVRQALTLLPAEQLAVLQRSFYDGQAHAHIAEDLGIPLGTVKSRIRLAVTQLRRLLDELRP
jgi:RNA polymerase sigma factor (sigma-70 family)